MAVLASYLLVEIWHLVDANKYLLSEWVSEWMDTAGGERSSHWLAFTYQSLVLHWTFMKYAAYRGRLNISVNIGQTDAGSRLVFPPFLIV